MVAFSGPERICTLSDTERLLMNEFIIRYYPDTPVGCYPYTYHELDFSHLPVDQQQDRKRAGLPDTWTTGSMDFDRYNRLKDDIAENGMVNPLIIEWFAQGKDTGQGRRSGPCLAVRVGNNRACVLKDLGVESAPCLFVVPASKEHLLPDGEYVRLDINSSLLSAIRELSREVTRAVAEQGTSCLGMPDAWMDSNLLDAIVRGTMDDPHQLQPRSEK